MYRPCFGWRSGSRSAVTLGAIADAVSSRAPTVASSYDGKKFVFRDRNIFRDRDIHLAPFYSRKREG
jgi:hypothetical protein